MLGSTLIFGAAGPQLSQLVAGNDGQLIGPLRDQGISRIFPPIEPLSASV
jgi:hypothetical protein